MMRVKLEHKNSRIVVMAILLAACCFLTYYFHAVLQLGTVFTHFFYIPIILACVWWKRRGLVVAIFLAAVLIFGHFSLRPDVLTANDYLRAGMFIVVAFIVDWLSERVAKGEKALRESKDRFRSLVETTSDLIWEVDRNGIYTYVSPRINDLLGYQAEEVIGKTPFHLMPPDEAARAAEVFGAAVAERKPLVGLVNTNLHKDGLRITLETSGIPIFHPARGDFVGYRGIDRDISERKQEEEATKLAYVELNQIFNASADGMRVVDKDFNVLRINQTLVVLSGASEGEALEKKCYEVFHGPLCHTSDCPMVRILRGEERVEREIEKERRDGTRISCILVATPFRRSDGGLIGIIEDFKDITERRKAEEALRVLAAQAEKTAAISVLAGGIAHELNNPMMGMLNFAQYCLKHTDRDDRRYPVLEDIVTETKRCADIVQYLLSFSHVGNGEREKAQRGSLAGTIARVVRLLAYRIGKDHVSATCHIARGIPEIWMQPTRIQEALLNLISNALDALEDTEKKEIHVQVRRDGEFVQLAVADNGHGIAPENLDRLFDPFFTTKAAGKGTGLGLSVTRSIIDEHGGKITCHSKPGVRTTFKVLLPIEKRQEEATQ